MQQNAIIVWVVNGLTITAILIGLVFVFFLISLPTITVAPSDFHPSTINASQHIEISNSSIITSNKVTPQLTSEQQQLPDTQSDTKRHLHTDNKAEINKVSLPPANDLVPLPTAQRQDSLLKIERHSSNVKNQRFISSTKTQSNQLNNSLDAQEDHNDNDEAIYTIAGHVLNEAGQAVPGIEVVAQIKRLFSEQTILSLAHSSTTQSTFTDSTGAFLLPNLLNGEYELRTKPTSFYLAAHGSVRADSNSVKLVVVEQREIWVAGLISDNTNYPLADVAIIPTGSATAATVSDASGRFGFPLLVRSDRSHLIRFSAEGYQEQRVSLKHNDWINDQQAKFDVILQPARTPATVAGIIVSETGDPIINERVYLQRQGSKYRATSDSSGQFIFNEVESGYHYALWLIPKAPYKKYRQERLKVSSQGLAGIEIILESTGLGSIYGQMIDPKGNAIPNFTLTARSHSTRSNSLPVTSDQDGYFTLLDLPNGQLRLETSSFPRFVISGIQLFEGNETQINPVLDLGNQQLSGRIIDEFDQPIGAANITLSWVYRDNGIVHESMHKTASGADGYFLFTDLSNQTRTVIVSAAGYQTKTIEEYTIAINTENFEIQLQPLMN